MVILLYIRKVPNFYPMHLLPCACTDTFCYYCMGQAIPTDKKKTFYRQALKLGANEASAQGLQNAL